MTQDQTQYRVEVTDNGRTWAGNALTFNTVDEAEDYATDLAVRWTAVRGWRIVPVNHPRREVVDYEATADAGFRCRDLT